MNVVSDPTVAIAAVNRFDGTFYKGRGWDALTPAQQKLVQLHEVGHYILQSVDESECDKFALAAYLLDRPGIADALRDFVGALSSTPEEIKRAQTLVEFAIYMDAKDGGKESEKIFKFLNPVSGFSLEEVDNTTVQAGIGLVNTVLGGLFGNSSPAPAPAPSPGPSPSPSPYATPPKEESNTGLYIALGAGFLVLILAVVFLVIFMRK